MLRLFIKNRIERIIVRRIIQKWVPIIVICVLLAFAYVGSFSLLIGILESF